MRFFCCLLLVFASQSASALDCSQLKHMVSLYIKMHLKFDRFDDTLSERTLDNFLKAWDPGKVYLLQEDVTSIRKRYSTKLDNQILNSKCHALDKIMNTYARRFKRANNRIDSIIAIEHDFSLDEYMVIDRKKISYAATEKELQERWRKRIKFQLLQLKTSLQDLKKARKKLTKRYQLVAKRHNELTSDDVYASFLSSFAAALDPHSGYLAAEQLEDFQIKTRLSLEGIGAVLRSEDGFTTIQSLVPGGAAEKSGLVQENDKIIGVAQAKGGVVDIIDMDLREVVKLIRGERGTAVKLTVLREGKKGTQKLRVTIIREKIKLKDQEVNSKIYRVKDTVSKRLYNVGVVNLPSFYIDFKGRQDKIKNFKSSSRDLKNEIIKLKRQKIDAMVLDLRSNGGGSLDEAISVAGLFVDKGPIVQVKATGGNPKIHKDDDGVVFYSGPLVVLINRHSASASEIVAGAIRDYQRGIIVGDKHTFGKGTVQSLSEVSREIGAVKITISKFYRPSGASTQLQGVEADIVFPSIADELEMGEKYYDYALEWERIRGRKYKPLGHTSLYIRQLAKASAARIRAEPKFQAIIENINNYKKEQESRTRISLQEKPQTKKEIAETKKEQVKKTECKTKHAKRDLQGRIDVSCETKNQYTDLLEDVYLQEALKISADYAQLLVGKKLGKPSIPALEKLMAETTPAPK